jgi:hypothetical protein
MSFDSELKKRFSFLSLNFGSVSFILGLLPFLFVGRSFSSGDHLPSVLGERDHGS